jgi:hypothetical protein
MTLGPWKTYSPEGEKNGRFSHSVCRYNDLYDDAHICVATAMGDSEREAFENARLIAAAPELYEALLTVTGTLEQLAKAMPILCTLLCESLKQAEEALAKAKGA